MTQSSTRFALLFCISSLALACSGPAAPAGPGDAGSESGPAAASCTVTLSGAVTATKPCVLAAADDDKGLHFGIEATDGTFAFAANLPGSSLATGTYPTSATTEAVGTVAQGTAAWAEFYDDGQHPNQGDATFSITDVGQQVTGSSGVGWLGVHGTLTATLPPADQFASGTVAVSATF